MIQKYDNYQEAKREVLEAYSIFIEYVKNVKGDTETPYDNLIKYSEKLAEDINTKKLKLMVIGKAKCGKSTFLNAYMGVDILPMGDLQCTASIIEISHGNQITCKITYAGDSIPTRTLTEKEEIQNFLKTQAAVNDEYRDIPVSYINYEILLKNGHGKRLDDELFEVLDRFRYSTTTPEDYKNKVKTYIEKNSSTWENIVKKIEITIPFPDEELFDVAFVDSPGILSDGGVGDVSLEYAKEADALIILKTANEDVEDTAFKSSIADILKKRRAYKEETKKEYDFIDIEKDPVFLIFTQRDTKNPTGYNNILKRAKEYFEFIEGQNIIGVYSLAKYYANEASQYSYDDDFDEFLENNRDDIKDDIYDKWEISGKIISVYTRALIKASHFDEMKTLEDFARGSMYRRLVGLTKVMKAICDGIIKGFKDKSDCHKGFLRAEDKHKVEKNFEMAKKELDDIQHLINDGIDEIKHKYDGADNPVENQKNEMVKKVKSEIDKIDPDSKKSIDELKMLLSKITIEYNDFTKKIIDDFLKECTELLQKYIKERYVAEDDYTIPVMTPDKYESMRDITSREINPDGLDIYKKDCIDAATQSRNSELRYKFFGKIKYNVIENINTSALDCVLHVYKQVNAAAKWYKDQCEIEKKNKQQNRDNALNKKKSIEEKEEELKEFEKIISDIEKYKDNSIILAANLEGQIPSTSDRSELI